MNLSTKVFFIAILTFLIVLSSVIWLSYTVVLSDYKIMEKQDIEQELIRTTEALKRIDENLLLLLADWAHWDDAYQFLEGKKPDFKQVNLMNKGSFVDTHINYILFYDNNGQFFAGNGFDFRSKEFSPIPKSLFAFIDENKFILKHQVPQDSISGFIKIPEGLVLLASYAVSNNASSETPNGNGIFAYYFDKAHLDNLAQTLQVKLDLYYLNEVSNNAELKNILVKLDHAKYYSVPVNDKIIFYYSLLRDIKNNPIAILKTTFPRDTYQEGLATIHTYIIILGIIYLLVLIFAELLLRFFILGRVNLFKDKLSQITSEQDFSKHIEISGKDEIYDAVENCNKMLDVINSTQNQLNLTIQELTSINKKITHSNEELKEREHAMVLINKINEKLQMCQNITEAYSVINEITNDLFPGWNGGIAIADKNSNELATVTQWGSQKILKNYFQSSECWAVRSGNIYIVDKFQPKTDCQHFLSTEFNKYLCIPLIISGKVIGILNLCAGKEVSGTDHYRQQLAITLSEVIALSVANINLRDSLREQTIHDSLTDLFNHRYLKERFPIELQRAIRNNATLGVAMIDLDLFKKINENYGHNAGDEALKQIALLLNRNFRGYDLVCRFGSDKFVVIIVESIMDKTYEHMQLFREEVKKTQIIFNHVSLPPLTVSIGLAEAPTDGTSLDEIMQKVELALYHAKNKGRDRVEIYNKG